MSRKVFYDGSIASAAAVLMACNGNERVHVILSRTEVDDTFLRERNDAYGSLRPTRDRFAFARGSPRFCATADDAAIEHFFEWLGNIEDDQEVDRILQMLDAPCKVCGLCFTCLRLSRIAEEYGIYDMCDRMRT